ncbi:GIN domain-containing protein [Brevundimonas sp.]|jgi:hypothetical protein|uniref:GIN domain-containing protein n=1 Tax=Brevundimonas sp. TaxID=1871086 RepID=UPI002E0DD2F0|nr:DUF2807 domain-containing protein [Brevundimonas sp.]
MIRNLLIIMGVGLVMAVVGIGGAFAVGGPAIMRDGFSWTWDGEGDWVRVSHEGRGDRGPEITRTLEWTGGDRLVLDAAADVVFTQGDVASVTVTGPERRVNALKLENGRLFVEGAEVWGGWRDQVRVTITAPNVSTFELNGSQELSLRAIDVPTLRIAISGSGEVVAEGRAQTLDLDVSGSGEADLTALTVVDADVDVSGSGEVDVGPTGRATIDISGSGDVDLTRRPTSVQSNVSGSGDVNDAW